MDAEMVEYINSIRDDRRELYARLEGMVLEMYPEAELVKSYGIPKYQNKLGKGGVFMNYWKEGVSMHGGGTDYISEFVAAHPEIKTGKGSLNFRLSDHIPEEDVKAFIHRAMQRK
jgi:uncharacterized protein YdhG (YjbR/CyaY superfamily)